MLSDETDPNFDEGNIMTHFTMLLLLGIIALTVGTLIVAIEVFYLQQRVTALEHQKKAQESPER